MKIKELFSKDIERSVNPAVVVSKQDDDTVKTEIEEYVFTQTIIENLYRYLNTLFNSKQDKTGIWINGFYGSGKSHFIKYIYYCLHPKISEDAFKHFIEEVKASDKLLTDATPSNIDTLRKKIQKFNVDTIIFNIDAVSGNRNVRERITKIFLNQFNAFRGYNRVNPALALLLEKHLDKTGFFEEFKKKIKNDLKEDWEKKGHLLISTHQSKVLNIAKSLDNDLDTEALSSKLKNPDDITISDHFIPELVEFLESKDDNYRLVFLVDEISQYIGTNSNLLLNLQTIIEEIGSQCGNKIWLSTTAQQTIEDLIQNTDNKEKDFGKILGRYETRISLESQNTTYITQKRILDKKSEAIKILSDFYNKNKEHIENQFIFPNENYNGYKDKNDFVLSYPFVPYQFKLISNVFENFANLGYVIKEVKDNERSILGITHFTAKEFKDNEVGDFVSFDKFFNQQMRNNLTHHANRILEPALNIIGVADDGFAQRVVLTLFMIANLSDTKKLTFPPNIDNLVLLLLDKPDVNRLDLQNKIQKVLENLKEQTIIYEEDEQYNFYKEEEIDVAKQIDNQTISLEDRLTVFHEDIFSKILRVDRKVTFGNNNFSLSLKVDDKEIYHSGDIDVLISLYDNAAPSEKALNVAKNDLVVCVNEWFMKEDSLRKEFENYVKTKKFIKLNYDSAVGNRKKAIEKFGDQNQKKVEDLKRRITEKLNQTSFISNNQVLTSSDINGSSPQNRLKNALEKHLEEIYKKNHLVKGYAESNDALKRSAADQQIDSDKNLTEAETQVNSYIENFGDSITVEDVIKHFLKPPFGWRDISTLDVLIQLARKNRRKFEWRSDIINLKDFAEKAIRTNERTTIVVKSVDVIDQTKIKETRNAFREIFNEDLKEDTDQSILFDEIKEKLKAKLEHYQKLNDDYRRFPFGKHFNDFVKILSKMNEIRDPKTLFDHLVKFKDNSKEISDKCKDLEDFIDNQLSKYKDIQKFTFENVNNFEALEEDDRKKASVLQDYFQNEENPSDRFPQINKIYRELSKSLESLMKELQKNAEDKYKKVYADIENKAKELNVSEPGIVDDKKYKMEAIKNASNISDLRLLISNANQFKSQSIKNIIDYSNKQSGDDEKASVIIDHLDAVIKSEEDLDNYLDRLRKQIKEQLDNKLTVIIE